MRLKSEWGKKRGNLATTRGDATRDGYGPALSELWLSFPSFLTVLGSLPSIQRWMDGWIGVDEGIFQDVLAILFLLESPGRFVLDWGSKGGGGS